MVMMATAAALNRRSVDAFAIGGFAFAIVALAGSMGDREGSMGDRKGSPVLVGRCPDFWFEIFMIKKLN